MPVSLDNRLVVAVASSALFDLTDSDRGFREQGEEPQPFHQREHRDEVPASAVAFPLTRRLLALNGPIEADAVVEVVCSATGERFVR